MVKGMVGLPPDKVHCSTYVACIPSGAPSSGTGYTSHVGHSFDQTS